MCTCTPAIRTPFCGKIGCEWPKQKAAVAVNVLKVFEKPIVNCHELHYDDRRVFHPQAAYEGN